MSTKLAESTLGHLEPTPIQELAGLKRFIPFALPLLVAGLFILMQWQGVVTRLSTESTLVVLALISYIAAAIFGVMYVLQRERLLDTLAIWTAALGFGLNIAAWGTRGLITHHYPLSNLYDTALALGLTTAGATLVIWAIYGHRFVSAFTLPIATMFLILAILYGDQIIDMPPVLVSYWRPIHVSIAMTAYGVCALTFALGVLYLIKAGMRTETINLFALLVPLLVTATVSGGSMLTRGAFEMNLMIGGARIPVNEEGTEFLRAQIPYVGQGLRLAFLGSLLGVLCFLGYLRARPSEGQRADESTISASSPAQVLKRAGHWFVRVTLLLQIVGLGVLLVQMKTTRAVSDLIVDRQRHLIPPTWIQEFGSRLELVFRSNPVGIASLVVAMAVTAFAVVFTLKREQIVSALPSLEVLDELTYKGVTVAFPLLVLMTITGAVWANESWGRYWGWDPKETWALITCICYAIFLHTRIVHGWKGKKTALFAVIGFVAVIFTYLGVSFILPGLHSYATL